MGKHRTPREMPQEIRLAYGKIAGLMLMATPYPEASVVVVFYRALLELALKEKERRAVLEFVLSPDSDLACLCHQLMSVASEEERNLLRFSLVEDVYHMMMADHTEAEEETFLFNQVLEHLSIEEEHLERVRQMYGNDSAYLPEKPPEILRCKIARQTAAGLVGLGVPVAMVAVSGEDGLSPRGIASGLKALSPGKKHPKSLVPGLLLTLAAGGMAWRTAKWVLHYPDMKRQWMLRRLNKSETKRLRLIVKNLDHDVRSLHKQIEERTAAFAETNTWITLVNLLKRSRSLVTVMTGKLKG